MEEGFHPTVIQELGGFVSVVASFHAARSLGLDNWFIEPSFFRGRIFFVRNSFAPPPISFSGNEEVGNEINNYLDTTLSARALAIPTKDAHQYRAALLKIANLRNFRRLAEKLVDKHIRGMHQEFGHIGHHVSSHARMLLNSARLRRHQLPLDSVGRYIYYPLHVPADVALTLRSPQFLDQLGLVDYIARSIPHTHRLVIKEHPAQVGALEASGVLRLLERHDNIRLLAASTNNFSVLSAADAVVSVNSKSGAEALLFQKPVLVLGDAFYSDSPLVTRVINLSELPGALEAAVHGRLGTPASARVRQYFGAVWRQTFPGELYVSTPSNVATFSASLLSAVQ